MDESSGFAKWMHSRFSESSFKRYINHTHRFDIQSKRGEKYNGDGRPSMGESWIDSGISKAIYFRRSK